MALVGVNLQRANPDYTIDDFLFWMPQFKNVLVPRHFEIIKEIANAKIFKSIYTSDWSYAMALCIAHYLELKAANHRLPVASSFDNLSGGNSYKGTISSMSVGAFSKSVDLNSSIVDEDGAKFWNMTSHGATLMALMKTKPVLPIFVVDNR